METMSAFDDAHYAVEQARIIYDQQQQDLIDLRAEYEADELQDGADFAAMGQEILGLESDLEARNAYIDVLLARIDELDGTEEPPPPPPPVSLGLQIGCNQGSIPGCASPTQGVRIYAGAPFQAASAALGTGSNWGDHVGKRTIAITFNDENLTNLRARINTFLNSVPKVQMQGKLRLYITNVHEPERGDKGNDPAACRAWTKETILSIRAWRQANLLPDGKELNVWCNPNYMSWFERDAISAGTSTRDWWPKDVDLSDVVLGLDPYDPTRSRDIDYLTEPTRTLWKLDGGSRYNICEVNTKRCDPKFATPADGVTWWRNTFANISADLPSCELALLFLHASAGKDAPWVIDQASATEFNAQILARAA
jgi:hypothetical protein